MSDANNNQTDLVETLLEEGTISTGGAAKIVGPRASAATIIRFMENGCHMPDGTILRLEHMWIAGRRVTSRQAVLRFIRAQNAQPAKQTV